MVASVSASAFIQMGKRFANRTAMAGVYEESRCMKPQSGNIQAQGTKFQFHSPLGITPLPQVQNQNYGNLLVLNIFVMREFAPNKNVL